MKPLTCCLSVIVLLAASAAAYADAKSDAVARAKAIAPFVEAETAIVVHVDLTRIALQPTFGLLCQILPDAPIDFRSGATGKILGELLGAGVKEFYVVAPVGNQGGMPRMCDAVPLPPGVDAKELRRILRMPADAGKVIEGMLVCPFPIRNWQTDAQLGAFRPVNRPELTTAFEAAGDSAVQVALIPPAYAPRVIEELLPQFPKELGGGPTTILTRGVSWAAAGIDLPPHPAVRLTIRSADAQAAEALRAKLAEMMRLAGLHKEIRATVPKFDEAVALLTPNVEGDRLVVVLNEQNQGVEKLLSIVTLAVMPPIEAARTSARRMQSSNNLKQIALAMYNYHAEHKCFPLPASHDKEGKPLLSWRVHLLRYFDQDLFRQFHLDEPWDSPHNRTLIDKMPSVYRLPHSKTEKGRTNYLLPVGGGAVFEADKPTTLKQITDGTSNTIMTVEVDDDHAVIWTKPEDLQFDPKEPTKGLSRIFNGGFNAGLCDGSVLFLQWPKEPKEIERLRYLFQRADGHPIQW